MSQHFQQMTTIECQIRHLFDDPRTEALRVIEFLCLWSIKELVGI